MWRKCIGFGKYEGVCKNMAGSPHSDHWCPRCDKLRLESISRNLANISKKFDEMNGEE